MKRFSIVDFRMGETQKRRKQRRRNVEIGCWVGMVGGIGSMTALRAEK